MAASDTASPYEAVLTAPLGVPSATLGARAIDLVGDAGVAPEVTLSVTPSPPPTVVITSPAPGFEAIEGTLLPIAVTATDDLGVASVEFLVNGDGVFTDSTAPYELDLRVPQGPGPITLGARATDEIFLSGAELGLAAFSGANVDGIAALGDGSILFTTGIEPTGAPGSAVAQEALSGFAESHVYRSTGDGANSLFASGADLGLAQVFEPGSGATDGISLP